MSTVNHSLQNRMAPNVPVSGKEDTTCTPMENAGTGVSLLEDGDIADEDIAKKIEERAKDDGFHVSICIFICCRFILQMQIINKHLLYAGRF